MSQIQKFVRRHRGLSAGLVLAGLSLLVAAAAVYHALQPVEAPIPVTLSAGASEWVAYREEFDACLAALEAGDQVEALRIHEGMATDKRGWEWDFLGAHFDQTLAHHDADFYEAPLGFDEAGRALSVRRVDDRAELFDVERGERIADLGPAAHRTIFRFDTDVTRIAKIHESRVRVHDLETLDVLLEVPTVEDGMTVDLEGDTLAIGTPDGRIDVWSVARRERNFTFEPSAPLTSSWRIELDRTGRVLACAQRPLPGEPTVMLLDAATGERLAERPFPSSAFNAAAMSRDGSLLAVTQPTGLHVLELPSLETRLAILGSEFDTRQPLTGSAIACLAFTPDGRAVLNSPATGIVTGYDVSSGEISSTRVVPVGALRTLVRSDGARALTSGHGRARYVHLQALGRPSVRVLADHDAPVHAIAMDPEGAWLATGDTGGAIHLRNLSGAGLEATVRVEGAVRQLWFAGGGSRLAARGGSEEAELVLWDLSGERPMLVPATATEPKPPGGARMRGAGREVVTSVLSPDARVELITGSEDSIRVVDARTRKRLHVLPGHDGGTAAVAVSADGRWIASAGRADGTIKLWERPTGEQVVTITAGAVGLLDLDFHPDGRRLASVGSDGAVRLWELESFQLAAVFPGDARAARFSSDGSQLLAALADGTVRAWDSVPPHERERE